MATAAELRASVATLKQEVGETATRIETLITRIEELLGQVQIDTELRLVVDETVAELHTAAQQLNVLQGETQPTEPPAPPEPV